MNVKWRDHSRHGDYIIFFSVGYNYHTNDYLKNMEILKLKDIYTQRLLVYMFKNQNFTTHSDIHSYNTRGRQELVLPRFNRTRSQTSFLYQGMLAWNSLPLDMRNIPYEGAFKSSVKRWLLADYWILLHGFWISRTFGRVYWLLGYLIFLVICGEYWLIIFHSRSIEFFLLCGFLYIYIYIFF